MGSFSVAEAFLWQRVKGEKLGSFGKNVPTRRPRPLAEAPRLGQCVSCCSRRGVRPKRQVLRVGEIFTRCSYRAGWNRLGQGALPHTNEGV